MRRPRIRSVSVASIAFVLAFPAPVVAAPPWLDPAPAELDTHALPLEVDPAATVRYVRPVPGTVLRVFDPPATLFGAGHRGVDLAAPVGSDVRAAADGVVAFTGPVAGTRWVTVAHADGVLTSYGPLAAIAVRAHEPVRRGAVLGVLAGGGHGDGAADGGLHWGARRHGRYLDPLELLEDRLPRPSLVGPGAWRGIDHAVTPYEPWVGGTWAGLRASASPVAERPGFAVAPSPNHLVLVGGLGSSSTSRLLDPSHLGYDPGSVTRFSYAGLDPSVIASDPADHARGQRPYRAEDTWEGIDAGARALEQLLRTQAAREPGRAVDLTAHSMGGLVVLRYLTRYHDPYDPGLPPIGAVVTVASPHTGSDLATFARAVRDGSFLGPALDGLRELMASFGGELGRQVSHLDLDAPAIDQLAVGSSIVAEIAGDWERAVAAGPAGPLAMGTRVLTIGGAGDLVVPTIRSDRPVPADAQPALVDARAQVEHRVLPGGHQSVLETEALREVVWRFLAGQQVVDSPGRLSTVTSGGHAGSLQLLSGLLRLHDLQLRPVRWIDRE